MARILIVEDEKRVADLIKKGLESNGFQSDIAYDGLLGKKMAAQYAYELIILDINLPVINGIELCKQIRESNLKIPILMLTAFGTMDDKLSGFNAGADDYIVKPFEIKELVARIRVFLKRSQPGDNAEQILKVANLTMDTGRKTVYRGNRKITLTAKEFSLLEYLLRNQGKVISKAELAEKIWEITFDTGTNIIEVYINYLRNKIDKNYTPKLIYTMVGMGYKIEERMD